MLLCATPTQPWLASSLRPPLQSCAPVRLGLLGAAGAQQPTAPLALQSAGWSAFTWALAGVLLVNGAALSAFIWKRERSLVNAWTGPVLAANIVLVPRGYHPVAAGARHDLYYLNVMAGPNRFWVFKNDPAHEWMLAPQAQ